MDLLVDCEPCSKSHGSAVASWILAQTFLNFLVCYPQSRSTRFCFWCHNNGLVAQHCYVVEHGIRSHSSSAGLKWEYGGYSPAAPVIKGFLVKGVPLCHTLKKSLNWVVLKKKSVVNVIIRSSKKKGLSEKLTPDPQLFRGESFCLDESSRTLIRC